MVARPVERTIGPCPTMRSVSPVFRWTTSRAGACTCRSAADWNSALNAHASPSTHALPRSLGRPSNVSQRCGQGRINRFVHASQSCWALAAQCGGWDCPASSSPRMPSAITFATYYWARRVQVTAQPSASMSRGYRCPILIAIWHGAETPGMGGPTPTGSGRQGVRIPSTPGNYSAPGLR